MQLDLPVSAVIQLPWSSFSACIYKYPCYLSYLLLLVNVRVASIDKICALKYL